MPVGNWVAAGVGLALLAAGMASAQVYEERMSPAEIGVGDVDSLVVPAARYVGNDTCRTCHPDAYRIWLGTKHARAFVSLRSSEAEQIAGRDGVTDLPSERSGKCLVCHATAYNTPAAYRKAAFRIGEGVSCEQCHGPGETHVRAMGSAVVRTLAALKMFVRQTFRRAFYRDGGLESLKASVAQDCMICHQSESSHEMLARVPFSFVDVWPKIAHPEDQKK